MKADELLKEYVFTPKKDKEGNIPDDQLLKYIKWKGACTIVEVASDLGLSSSGVGTRLRKFFKEGKLGRRNRQSPTNTRTHRAYEYFII